MNNKKLKNYLHGIKTLKKSIFTTGQHNNS